MSHFVSLPVSNVYVVHLQLYICDISQSQQQAASHCTAALRASLPPLLAEEELVYSQI